MSISYEEALATLQSMFGDSWTREDLDTVLRNQKGHMENTVDLILRNGDKEPSVLVEQLQSGVDPEASTRAMDEQLAQQLAQGEVAAARRQRAAAAGGGGGGTSSSSTPQQQQQQYQGRGKPTTLPDDFLRIPGYRYPAAARATAPSAGSSSALDDEALARMLQDELFSEELARNPDFAHLARGRPRTVGGVPVSGRGGSSAAPAHLQQQHRPSFNLQQQTGQVMEKISDLGDTARRRLQLMAAQFNARNTSFGNTGAGGGSGGGGGGGGGASSSAAGTGNAAGHVAASERRGLLDADDMDDMELAARKDL